MENLGERNILRIPLSNLWDVPAIRQKIETDATAFAEWHQQWYCSYSDEARLGMHTQLRWALENPAYNFQQMLTRVTTSNEDILFYFAFLLNVLEQAQSKPEDQFTP
jgi:hypothetical protein